MTGRCAKGVPHSFTALHVNNTGRNLKALGRLTEVGDFPTGGALTPDGAYYWSVSSGGSKNDVRIVSVASGAVVQELPLPGAYGGIVIAADGKTAYVSGEPVGGSTPDGKTVGDSGDVIHVFAIDPATGKAQEQAPLALPSTQGGSGRLNSLPPAPSNPGWPAGLALTADSKTLVVALNNADKAVILDTASGSSSTVSTGSYPLGVAIERSGRYAYVGSEYDGTLTRIDLKNAGSPGATTTISGIGGPDGDKESHPQFLLADPQRDLLYVAVTNHDGIAVLDTVKNSVTKFISLKRPQGYGVAPVTLALAPDGQTLYAADAGEDAIAAIAAADRGGYHAYDVIGRLPTGFYAHDVQVTPDGCNLVWAAAKGVNTSNVQYVLDQILGRVGVVGTPTDAQFAAYASYVDAQLVPDTAAQPPAMTPVQAADGGASAQIKHVFFIVRENRNYDQIFGTDPRGDGAPERELFDDNGVSGPTGGSTPNAHALSRAFQLFDHFYNDSEVSSDGHVITTSVYASDYVQRSVPQQYEGRGRPYDAGIFPVSFPPKDSLFDQMALDGISFHNYGEGSGGNVPGLSSDGRSTEPQLLANYDAAYPNILFIGCLENSDPLFPNSPSCAFDSGMGVPPPLAQSRVDIFNKVFGAQVQAGQVPSFSYFVLPNDHTHGTTPGDLTPQGMIADNDLGLGQIVQIISHSSIWPQSAIFVVEDDSQEGSDHVDAHRSVAFVISPWARRNVAIHTRYDQYSLLRTMELILGMPPLSLYDAYAAPMYEAFSNTPDNTPYAAIMPQQKIGALNPKTAANAALSRALPWNEADAVPQELSDRILWQAVHGAASPPPAPGPNASPVEHARAQAMLRAVARGKNLRSTFRADDD